MAKVEDWFPTFMMNLMLRSGRQDWPDPEDEVGVEFWADFKRALIRCGAAEDEADEASSAACDVPDLWPNQYRPMVIAAIKSLQARKQEAQRGGNNGVNTMDEARTLAKDCADCRGMGLILRFVHASHAGRFVTPGGVTFPIGAKITLLCGCPLGLLFRKLNAEAPRESRHRMGSVAEFPEFAGHPVPWSDERDNQYRYHPDDWNLVDGCPMPQPSADEVKAQVRAATMARKGPGGSLAGLAGGRWRNAPWASDQARSEAAEARLEEAVAGAVPMVEPPAEYPDLSDHAELPSDPAEAAEVTGWF